METVTVTLSDGTTHEGYIKGPFMYSTEGQLLFRVIPKK